MPDRERTLQCRRPGCARMFFDQNGRDQHERTAHQGGRRTLRCPYCQGAPTLHQSNAAFYRSGKDYGPLWACAPCKAWVGCYPGTTKPLGRLANAELRGLKMQAHDAFDPLWRRSNQTRAQAYFWLAQRLGIKPQHCHIGEFDLEQCRRVIEICREVHAALKEARAA